MKLNPSLPPSNPLLQHYSKTARAVPPFTQPAPYVKGKFVRNQGAQIDVVRDKYGALFVPTKNSDKLCQPELGVDLNGEWSLISHVGKMAHLTDTDKKQLAIMVRDRFQMKMKQLLSNHLNEIQEDFVTMLGELNDAT